MQGRCFLGYYSAQSRGSVHCHLVLKGQGFHERRSAKNSVVACGNSGGFGPRGMCGYHEKPKGGGEKYWIVDLIWIGALQKVHDKPEMEAQAG